MTDRVCSLMSGEHSHFPLEVIEGSYSLDFIRSGNTTDVYSGWFANKL